MPANGILFQNQLIAHGACTLAHMKTGNLFRILKTDIPNCDECMRYFNDQCSPFGYCIRLLKETETGILVYVYNAQKLQSILSKTSIQGFLSDYGYNEFQIDQALLHLQKRLLRHVFPHEIGVFLGYPLQDIRQFITPQKECLLIGYWKVYGNAKNTRKRFYRYDCCIRAMKTKVSQGESLITILKKLN